MAEFQELTSILKDLLTNRFAPKPNFVRGLLGDGQGNVKVPGGGKEDKSFVRFNRSSSETFEIFNKEVNPVDNWPVLIGELPGQPGMVQVVGTDWAAYEQTGWGSSVGGLDKHAPTHEWPAGAPGSDPLNVYIRSMVPLKSYSLGSGSTQVFVGGFNFEYMSTGTVWAGVPGIELGQGASTTPATGSQRLMGIYHNPQINQLFGVTGSLSPWSEAITPTFPSFPAGMNPSAWIRLYGGQNTIAEADIIDARYLFGGHPPTGPAFGDLTGSYPNPQVQGILGFPIEGTLGDNDILQFSGTSWILGPVALTGPAGGDLTGSYPNPQVQGLLGFPIQGTLNDNDILQFSGTSWSVEPLSSSTGWPFKNTLTVSTTDPDADYSTIAAANTAANAGDIILLDAETWGNATITKAVTLMGLDPVNVILTTTGSNTILIGAAGITIRNLTVNNTGTGSSHNCIALTQGHDGTVIDNCIVNKVSGASTTSRGIYNANDDDAFIKDTRVTVTAGTTRYGYRADTSASSAKIIGGSYEGSTDDISLNHASANIELNDPVLENDTLTVTAGNAIGWYYNASGDHKNSELEGGDVFPRGLGYGLSDRIIEKSFSGFVSHFTTGDVAGAGDLTGYTFSVAAPHSVPVGVTYSELGDFLFLINTVGTRSFLQKSGDARGDSLYARVVVGSLGDGGIRVDDGTDNNYVSYQLRQASSSTPIVTARLRARTGGGAVITTDVTFDPVTLPFNILFLISSGASWGASCWIIAETGGATRIIVGATNTWTPSRVGLEVYAAVSPSSRFYYDWFKIP